MGNSRFGPELAFWLDCLGAGLWYQYNRATLEAERSAQSPGQKLRVLVRQQVVPVDEEQEGWRGVTHLRRVKELQPMTGRAGRLTPLDRIVKCAIQQCSRDVLLELSSHVANCL